MKRRPKSPVSRTVSLARWPRIQHALRVRDSGYIDCDYCLVVRHMDDQGVCGVERAETCEELAEFYAWRLTTRADEMATNPGLRFLLETWTDDMRYSLLRSAALARGEDPGPVVTQPERRPDLFADRDGVELAS